MAKKPILDLLPRNLEFHNLSHVTLTTAQSKTLGLGLKFRPTLRPPPVRVFENQLQDFCRSVRLYYKYANQPEDPDFNPKPVQTSSRATRGLSEKLSALEK